MLNIGMVVDNRYRIRRILGRGGTSCVYLAEHIKLKNYWAIKEIYKNSFAVASPQGNVLVAEADILTKLRHPGLPSITDIIHTSDAYLIVMEYVDGVSLDKVLEQRGAQNERDVIRWGQQLCDVLEYIHNQTPPIVYRDMKPGNIMLTKNGDVVLVDFGMARNYKAYSRHDTANLGTHGYAAPEQYSNDQQTDARTDIYSLGVTLYHLVTGRDPCLPPYGIQSIQKINPALSARLDNVIQKATKLRKEDRFTTASEMKKALTQDQKLSDSGRITEEEPDDERRNGMGAWWILGAVVPILLLLMVGGLVALTGSQQNGVSDLDDFSYQVQKIFQGEAEYAGMYFEQLVEVTSPDQRHNYSFVAEKSGQYHIYSQSANNMAPIVWLMDEDGNVLAEDNTSGDYNSFSVTYKLRAGHTYLIQTTLHDGKLHCPETGSFYMYVEYVE